MCMSDESNDEYYTAEEEEELHDEVHPDDVLPGFHLHTSPDGTVWIVPFMSVPPPFSIEDAAGPQRKTPYTSKRSVYDATRMDVRR